MPPVETADCVSLPVPAQETTPESVVPAEQAPSDAPEPAPRPQVTAGPASDEGKVITVTARPRSSTDPVEAVNVASFHAVQAVDKAFIGPVARTYKKATPKPLQDGLHNFLNNLDEPIVFVNFLLQLKPGKALETAGRFAINTTLGGAGLFDVAKRKPFKLPRRSNGLADTLGYYGVGPGPFLFLPVIGPTTVRDLAARPFDLLILPAAAGKPFNRPEVGLAKGTLSALDERAHNDDKLKKLRDESSDPYGSIRDDYLKRRQAEIDYLRGKRTSIEDTAPAASDTPPMAEDPATNTAVQAGCSVAQPTEAAPAPAGGDARQ